MSSASANRLPLLFFSHSSKDAELLKILVKAARLGLNLKAENIRFSSEEAYGFEPGKNIIEMTREECTEAAVLIGVLTPNSLKSGWVKTELDARWGANKSRDKPSFLVLANGTTANEMPSPHKDNLALQCTVEGLEALFKAVAQKLKKTYDYQTVREFFKEAEEYSQAMADAMSDEPGDILKGHSATAKASFLSPDNAVVGRNPVKFSVKCKKLPASTNSLWLCVEIESRVWPKQQISFEKINTVISSEEKEGGASKYYFLTLIEVDQEGQKQIKDWEKKSKEKNDYAGMEELKGAMLDCRLVIKSNK
jgi:hypothetical protein